MIDTYNIEIEKVTKSKILDFDVTDIQFGKHYSDHMFIADYDGRSWQNAKILPFGNISLSPANVTLHYGQSVFEGMKAYKYENGDVALFRPIDNFKRINISAERMCLQQLPEEVFMSGLTELVNLDRDWVPANEGTSLYIRPLLFATDEYIGIKPSDVFKFMIITSPAGAYYSKPVKVKIETHYSRAVAGGTGYAKAAGNYGGSLFPAKAAQEQGFDQLIWTDAITHEYIEESGTMNVMFLVGDTLITALAGDTILNGITRDSVLTLARDWGVNVEERKFSVKELITAAESGELKEAFGTGTAATITSIYEIGHESESYKLPESMEFAEKLKNALEGIKRGILEDKFHWMHVV